MFDNAFSKNKQETLQICINGERNKTTWLSFVMSNCDVVTFPLVSWVRCGA